MRKKLFIWSLLLVILVSSVSAINTDNNLIFFNFESDQISGSIVEDISAGGSQHNMTLTGITTGVTGKIGDAISCDGIDDLGLIADSAETSPGTNDFTVSFWVNMDDPTPSSREAIFGGDTCTNDNDCFITYRSTGGRQEITKNSANNLWNIDGQDGGVYGMFTFMRIGSFIAYFHNTTLLTSNWTYNENLNPTGWQICKEHITSNFFDGDIDLLSYWNKSLNSTELAELYNNGAGFNPYAPPIPPINTSLEQSFVDRQDLPITIGGGTTTIISDVFDIPVSNEHIYVTGNLQLVSNQNNELTCSILFDGDSFGSTTIRSNTASDSGSMFLATTDITASNGTHVVELVCERSSPPGNVEINNGIIILHNLIDENDILLNSTFQQSNFSVTSNGFPVKDSFIFTTSNKSTDIDIIRSVVINWDGQYIYNESGNISTEISMQGLINCSAYPRVGSNGDFGSVGGECILKNTTANQDINITVRGNGTGNVSMNIHVKEFIMQHEQINAQFLNSTTNLASSFKSTILITAFNMSINNTDRTNANMFIKAGIPVRSDEGDTIASCQFVVIGPKNFTGVIHNRSINESGFGMLIVEDLFEEVPVGNYQVILFGSCTNGNCTAAPTQMVAYLTDRQAFEPQFFEVQAQNNRTLTTITNFTVTDTTFFINTTTGAVNVTTNETFFNFTVSATNFFSTTITNHNTSLNITVNLTQFTIINATDRAGNPISIFNVNFTQIGNSSNTGTSSTTNGEAFLELFNGNFTVTIFNAQNSSIFFARESVNLTADPFNVSHTFILFQSNTFNLEIRYELDRSLVDDRNVTVQFISSIEALNRTTDNGTLTISLLEPSIIDIRYASIGFRERSFFFSLTNQSVNNLTLYMLDDVNGSLIIITNVDQSGQFVEGVTLQILKGFIINNQEVFQVVEMDITDFAGEAVITAQLNDVRYIIKTVRNVSSNEVLFLSNPFEITATTLRIILNTAADPLESFRVITALGGDQIAVSIPEYNNGTGTWWATFLIPDATIVSNICLSVDQITNFGFLRVNQTCVTANTGNITVGYFSPNLGSRANLELDTTTLFSNYLLSTNTFDPLENFQIFGGIGVFVGTWIISTIALAFLSNAALMIIAVLISLSGIIGLGIVGLSWAAWLSLVITGGILLFKMRK